MKTFFLHMLLLLLLAAGSSCSSDDDKVPDGESQFYSTPSRLSFDAGESTLDLKIFVSTEWRISCEADWLHVDPVEGSGAAKIKVSAQSNPLSETREATLHIDYGASQPALIPVMQRVSAGEKVEFFVSTEQMKEFLKARIEACNYAESVSVKGDVVKFGFKDAATRAVHKGQMPVFTCSPAGIWLADEEPTGAKADPESLRAGVEVEVSITAGGTIALDGDDTGVRAPKQSEVAICCVINTGKYICFAFLDGEMLRIGSELKGTFNPPLPVGGDSLKILFIGNSFMADATELLPQLLQSAGIRHVRLVRAYHGGYTLPGFYKNYASNECCTYYRCEAGTTSWEHSGTLNHSLKGIVESDVWDVVVLQEHTGSTCAWKWDEAEQNAIFGLCDNIHQAQPNHRPTLAYIMSQAYGATNKEMYPRYFPNQQEMFSTIVAQGRRVVTETCLDILIPTGTTLQNMRTSSLNKNNGMDLTRDTEHMDYGISRFAAAATLFHQLITPCTGMSVENNGYRSSASSTSPTEYRTPITDANAPIAVKAALEACRNPFAVTDMSQY